MAQRVPTLREFAADGIVHVVGIAAGLAGAAVLIVIVAMRGVAAELAAILAYALGLIAMLGCSAAYHLARACPWREWLRRFDHAAIFAMIAGTYTPFTTLRLVGAWAVGLTSAVWTVAAVGILVKLVCPHRLDRLTIGLYLALGWVGVVALEPLTSSLGWLTLALLGAGGLIYTIGVVFHVWERLPFHNAIWHACVLAAASVHYAAILDGIVMVRALL